MSLSEKIDLELIVLVELTKKKAYDEIKNSLQDKDKTFKGTVFELYIEELYKGNGWRTFRKGGKGDLGADILLYHPKRPHEVSLIVQTKNHKKPLSFDETRIELIKFEENAQEAYNCNNYILISINGFVKDALGLEEFNMKMESWKYITHLIDNYNPDATEEPEIELFAHNKLTYKNIIDIWKTSKKVAAVQATGTGKSYLITKVLSDFHNSNKLVLAPSTYILDTIKENAMWLNKQTTYMTFAKLMRFTDEQLKELKIELLVLDEFHRVGAEKWGEGVERLIKIYPDIHILGTSATPIRHLDGNRDMTDELFEGCLASEIKLPEAIVKGYLPEPYYVSSLYTLDEEIDNRKEKAINSSMDDESKQNLLLKLTNIKKDWEKTYGVPQILRKHVNSSTNKFIVFCQNKEHLSLMELLVEKWFKESGISANIKKNRVISDDKYKNEEMQEFISSKRKNTTHLLFAIDMLNEGLHIKDVTGVILLRPTESPIIFYQQIGRALASGNKNKPFIFDFVNNFNSIRSNDFITDLNKSQNNEEEIRSKFGLPFTRTKMTIYSEAQETINLLKNLDNKLFNSWEYFFDKLLEFKQEFTHCLVPQKGKKYRQLGEWVSSQRVAYNNNVLPDEKIDLLNSIDFVWDANEYLWNKMFEELHLYKIENGNCLVSTNDKLYGQLGAWVSTQRQLYKIGKLTDEKIKKLTNLEFVWNTRNHYWETMLSSLLKYKERYGNCLVPSDYSENSKLAIWVKSVRMRFKRGYLTEIEVKTLNDLGFVWNTIDSSWENMFQQLVEYRKKYGDCFVPSDYPENRSLGNWVFNIRSKYSENKLSIEKINKLNEIGFVWNVSKHVWNLKYNELLLFKKTHGNLLVEKKHNTQLFHWVLRQRNNYKQGKLATEKFEKLNDIGFIWNVEEYEWEFLYQELINYKKRNGDCLVPLKYLENPNLGNWVSNNRRNYLKNNLSIEKIKKLESIGFVWNVLEKTWDEMFEKLVEYKKNNGDCLVPADYSEDIKFAMWIGTQRKEYKNKKMSKLRIEKLESIGFVWDVVLDNWDKMYQELIEYKKKHGNCIVKRNEYPKLGNWVRKQRENYKKGVLSTERIEKLNLIGFTWEILGRRK
ncbi:Helicase associated domain protein [Bacillus thuringiensis]|uniref:Helicase associated domain protein n=1 Tax=Bacillus thuringiensis TaxID=1428 RepID=UPI0021D6938F|nr:Helicase associated domain protein [Bacillus thuringiensis]MCU7667753.1 Helicase associated domain protein [Bacillus thuringiensis]